MSPELEAAIKRARNHKMTPAERFEQRVSFVYGQQDWSSGNAISKAAIRDHLISIYGMPAQWDGNPQGGDAPAPSRSDDSPVAESDAP